MAGTLDYIVGQLDVVTSTLSAMNARLGSSESRVERLEATQAAILQHLGVEVDDA
jgi:hypothetical protein